MMKMRPNPTGMFSPARGRTAAGGGSPEGATFWEMRPRGMLVQKRNSDSEHSSIHIPTIKVKIKYGSSYFEFSISSQASFGELKKMVAGATGVHQEDQKLIFKEKVRESKTLLDAVGVNNGSIIVLIEEKQNLESRRNTKMDNASKEIAEINMAVDKFAMQVANLETQICGGERVVEKVLLNLIELLMTELIKLDGIVADGDIKLKRKLQVKRVQKYIETLDMLKMRNSMIGSGSRVVPLQQYNQQETNGKMQTNTTRNLKEQQKKNNHSTGKMMQPVVVTTNWVTLDTVVSKKLPFSSSASAIKYGNYNVRSKRNLEYFV